MTTTPAIIPTIIPIKLPDDELPLEEELLLLPLLSVLLLVFPLLPPLLSV
jgi:hypothetical protein